MRTAINNTFPMECRNVYFTKTEPSSVLNGWFTKDGLKAILEGKDYLDVDSVFPFVESFADRLPVRVKQHEQATSHTIYTQILNMCR